MAQPVTEIGYSADVCLVLVVAGRTVPLWQIGPNSITLRDPVELPPCEAEIVMYVDGDERRWRVFLPYGAVPFDSEVAAESY